MKTLSPSRGSFYNTRRENLVFMSVPDDLLTVFRVAAAINSVATTTEGKRMRRKMN
jgi:hypothetical protein